MVGLRGTEDGHDLCEQSLGACSHVDGPGVRLATTRQVSC